MLSSFKGIRGRLLLLTTMPMVVFGFVVVLAVSSLTDVGRRYDVVTSGTIPSMVHSYEIHVASSDLIRFTRGAMMTPEPDARASQIARARASMASLSEHVAALDHLALDVEGQSISTDVAALVEGVQLEMAPVFDLLAKNTMLATEEADERMRTSIPERVAAL
ncbi:MAG: hypothetical protein KDA28_13290, partial [Phycisphaerales bacterium]|nr:hypothetical protein [Phycisphaerales bacterium]